MNPTSKLSIISVLTNISVLGNGFSILNLPNFIHSLLEQVVQDFRKTQTCFLNLLESQFAIFK